MQQLIDKNQDISPKTYIQSQQTNYDFDELAIKYDELADYVFINQFGISTIHWNQPQALIALTRILMKEQYGVNQWDIPNYALCPTINSRRSYIDWIHFLIQDDLKCSEILGLDIGTGAGLIYPLIGFKLYGWRFVATDTNKASLANCESIKKSNHITDQQIQLFESDQNNDVFNFIQKSNQFKFSFSMCNPPFFSDWEQKFQVIGKNSSIQENEALTDGGEVSFLIKMIEQSQQYKDTIGVFTSLIGVKKHFNDIVEFLIKFKAKIQIKTQFSYIKNGKIKRWLVAWKFE